MTVAIIVPVNQESSPSLANRPTVRLPDAAIEDCPKGLWPHADLGLLGPKT